MSKKAQLKTTDAINLQGQVLDFIRTAETETFKYKDVIKYLELDTTKPLYYAKLIVIDNLLKILRKNKKLFYNEHDYTYTVIK